MKHPKLITPFLLLLITGVFFTACTNESEKSEAPNAELIGTWKLITGTTIKGDETTITDYTKGQEMIKIINETHFAFLRHDLNGGKDSSKAVYVAGGGRYTVEGNTYTEHLDYLNFREWEGNSFEFEFTIDGDTLITQGLEKVEELDVEYLNIEKYYRVKN